MALTAAAAACNFNGPPTAASPGRRRSVIPNSPIYGTLDVDTNGNVFVGGWSGGTAFHCVRSSNAQIGGQTPTFDRNTAVNLGGDLRYPGAIKRRRTYWPSRSWRLTAPAARLTTTFICWPVCCRPGERTTDVMFVRSTDGGLTFSAPHRINDDPVNPNKWHWFGTFSVAPTGVWMLSGTTRATLPTTPTRSYSIPGALTQASRGRLMSR